MISPAALALTALALLGQAPQGGLSGARTPAAEEARVVREQKPSYPLDTCPVSRERLGEKAVDLVVEGRLIRICCADCADGARQDAKAIFERIDAAVIAAQKPVYPLKTCPLTGEELGAKAVDVVRGTKLVRLCCSGCRAKLDKQLETAMAKVDEAWIASQKADYPLTVCPVSNEKLGSMGDPLDVLYGTTLVRLCCKGCRKDLEKDGPAIVRRIAEARASASPPASPKATPPGSSPGSGKGSG
jgi:hypothetical protein